MFSSFTFLKDEERKKFFFSGFEITQPPKNGSEQKKKNWEAEVKKLLQAGVFIKPKQYMAIIKVVGWCVQVNGLSKLNETN